MAVLLNHSCTPDKDDQTSFFNYVAYILTDGINRAKVEFVSYVVLSEAEILSKAEEVYNERVGE